MLDELLDGREAGAVRRLVISTTLVTNILATGSGARTALILIPGRGLPFEYYRIAPDTYFLKGSIDFRGNITEEIDPAEVEKAVQDIRRKGIERIAVAAKFAQRNRSLEQEIARMVGRLHPGATMVLGSEVAGRMNFPRRAVTAYYSAVTAPEWGKFADRVEEAVQRRGLKAPVHILKADGGTMPLAVSRRNPVETVFSGPAASAMGAVALSRRQENAVMIDMGARPRTLPCSSTACRCAFEGRIEGASPTSRRWPCARWPWGRQRRQRRGWAEWRSPRSTGSTACLGGPAATLTDAVAPPRPQPIGDMARKQGEKLPGKPPGRAASRTFAAAVTEEPTRGWS